MCSVSITYTNLVQGCGLVKPIQSEYIDASLVLALPESELCSSTVQGLLSQQEFCCLSEVK